MEGITGNPWKSHNQVVYFSFSKTGDRLRDATVLGQTHTVVFSSFHPYPDPPTVQLLIWKAWDVTMTDALKEAKKMRGYGSKVTGPWGP